MPTGAHAGSGRLALWPVRYPKTVSKKGFCTPEPCLSRSVPTHMALYPQYERDGLAGALAIHLCLYVAVGGCFALGLYELLQPARVGNPGLAAYQPPPRVLPTSS